MNPTCKTSGKKMMDKKGTMTVVNLAMGERHKEMEAYACEDCGSWHVASRGVKDFSNQKRSKETIHDKRRNFKNEK